MLDYFDVPITHMYYTIFNIRDLFACIHTRMGGGGGGAPFIVSSKGPL